MLGLRDPRVYRLNKEATRAVMRHHPWIFRGQLSSAIRVFRSGQFLRLQDADNRVVGHGVLEGSGAIGIRVLRFGREPPTVRFLKGILNDAVERRADLAAQADSYRLVHGENDGLPGVAVDLYGGRVLVLQTFSSTVDGIGRWAAAHLAREFGIRHVLWKIPTRRPTQRPDRWLTAPVRMPMPLQEGSLQFWVDLLEGQKSGSYLDLRGLRRWVSLQPLQGKRVLNLFGYTGALGVAAHAAGAAEVVHVDASRPALEFGRRHHGQSADHWIQADLFDPLPSELPWPAADLVIVDPPNMTRRAQDRSKVLTTYRRLYRSILPFVQTGGDLVVCCCTSRVPRPDFEHNARTTLGPAFADTHVLLPEPDHPVAFPEGDYLKVMVFAGHIPGSEYRAPSEAAATRPAAKPRRRNRRTSGEGA
jgi:23S rRNA G2069 N7-methylase RlmK/C1962 C5-methylase RlmI